MPESPQLSFAFPGGPPTQPERYICHRAQRREERRTFGEIGAARSLSEHKRKRHAELVGSTL